MNVVAEQLVPLAALPQHDGTGPDKAVVVHGGARDSYQLALALAEAGLLQTLVTDLFWPSASRWAARLARWLPGAGLLLSRRSAPLRADQVRRCWAAGLRGVVLDRVRSVPFAVRRRSNRAADATLGRTAGRLARRERQGLVAYSYFAYDAIRAYGRPALLFQVHPHPETMRRILREELALHPECAASLEQEWELALPEQDFARLVEETRMPVHYLVASSFTRRSLMEHGTPAERISVVPYGVDLQRFHPPATRRSTDGPLQLLFVGRINQRKGVSYLLEALALLPAGLVRLTVCGRVVDSLELFAPFRDQVNIRPSVSEAELVEAYQESDLFVFPSVAEGFGQVLLEALACGLPILSTTHTAAPDLIEHGREGWIVPPRRADLLAEHVAWAARHRHELQAMGIAARQRAEKMTWARFRAAAANVVGAYLHNEARDDDSAPR